MNVSYDVHLCFRLEVHFEKVLLSLSDNSQNFIVAPCHQHRRLFGTSSTDLQRMNSTRFFVSPNSLVRNHDVTEELFYVIDRHQHLFVSPNSSSTLHSSADNVASSDDEDLFFYRMLCLKLLHLMLFVDTFLIIYRVTNLCLEITSRRESKECVSFVHDTFDSLPQEIQKVKKKEKCVSFADLDKCSNELTKNFHSMQDMHRKLSTTATEVNVEGYVRCNSSSLSMSLRPNHSIQESMKPRLFHVLITLNSFTVLCPNMGSAADKQPRKGFHFACTHCIAYLHFFWKLVRRSDAIPRVVFASALSLLLGLVLNVVGQNVIPKFILSLANFCSCDLDVNSYLQDFVDANNKELALWQSKIMKFEVKQLQGIFEFFNAG